ncbi:phage holin family protein [Candidatus Kaiserbacteria bacterium]|nr:phage holin family protein [Candidatus Kaiserbacteria bacterium]
MIKMISRVLIGALALLLAANFIPGIEVMGLYTAIITALILGLLNMIVRPVLIVLTLPVTILTLGLFTFVINAALFWFAASFIEGFAVAGFVPALLGSIFVSIVSAIGNALIS